MMTETYFYQTPLHSVHEALGARMVGFGGWSMPLQYESILAEWEYNRKGVSLFDCSHMGEFLIQGDPVRCGLNGIVTQNIVDMPLGTCRYGTMLNSAGGVIDDLIVYRQGPEEWMLVVNAANITKDAAHIQAHLSSDVDFQDLSFKTAKLDLQGPQSRAVLSLLVPDIARLAYYTFGKFTIKEMPCLISRTGYTGELGYEIYCPWENAKEIWKTILNTAAVKPTGLAVRDVLRVEMSYSLYGHELDETISPLEAGLSAFIDSQKDFIGKEALYARSLEKTTGCFVSASRKSPRAGNLIWDSQECLLGTVSSGTFSFGLQAGIGIGFVPRDFKKPGTRIFFGDEKTKTSGEMIQRPFYKKGSFKT